MVLFDGNRGCSNIFFLISIWRLWRSLTTINCVLIKLKQWTYQQQIPQTHLQSKLKNCKNVSIFLFIWQSETWTQLLIADRECRLLEKNIFIYLNLNEKNFFGDKLTCLPRLYLWFFGNFFKINIIFKHKGVKPCHKCSGHKRGWQRYDHSQFINFVRKLTTFTPNL